MRILIVGAGAIGGYFGARLLAAGRDVTLLVRAPRAQQLAETGLVLRSPRGDLTLLHPPTVLASALRSTYDLVVLSCKAYDLAQAIEAFAPAVGPGTMILPLLNGMAHLDALDARFSRQQVLGGKCLVSVTLHDEGTVVHFNASHSLTFGERDGGVSPRVEAVLMQLSGAGFDVEVSPDIEQDMWEKWVTLATMAGATCLMRAPIGAIAQAAHGQALMQQLLAECAAIASAHGHAPRKANLEQIEATLTAPHSPLKASMLRDIERHGRIESDQIIGDLWARRAPGDLAARGLSALQIVLCHLKSYEATRA